MTRTQITVIWFPGPWRRARFISYAMILILCQSGHLIRYFGNVVIKIDRTDHVGLIDIFEFLENFHLDGTILLPISIHSLIRAYL